MMKLRYVTITGADNNVKPEELYQLYERYNFVEWGILFSQAKSRVPQYPCARWIKGLLEFADDHPMNLSAHLCDGWVDHAIQGRFQCSESIGFQRIQFNLYKERLAKAFNSPSFPDVLDSISVPVVLGGNYSKQRPDVNFFYDHGCFPLFDASGGHGLEVETWPEPVRGVGDCLFCGYAGGLGPDNVLEQLDRIAEAVVDGEVWIDIQTKVRTEHRFDLEKVEEVLVKVDRWICDTH